MTANLQIVTDEREDVLRIPNAALRFRPAVTSTAEARRRHAGWQTPDGGRARRMSRQATATEEASPQTARGRGGGHASEQAQPSAGRGHSSDASTVSDRTAIRSADRPCGLA